MDEKVSEQSVWTEFLSVRQARAVARALVATGYQTATAEKCRGYIINVAGYFEPGDPAARQQIIGLICQAAGLQPARG